MSHHLDPTDAQALALFGRGIEGPFTMLNLLRFRNEADYGAHPELAPDGRITGREAYERYIAHTLPFLEASGGSIAFLGEGGPWFVGPDTERWDLAMAITQHSLDDFLAFAGNTDYLAGIGHRVAAVEDARMLALQPLELPGRR